jgi:hypothetical protein
MSEERGGCANASRSRGGLDSGVTTADHDYVERCCHLAHQADVLLKRR